MNMDKKTTAIVLLIGLALLTLGVYRTMGANKEVEIVPINQIGTINNTNDSIKVPAIDDKNNVFEDD